MVFMGCFGCIKGEEIKERKELNFLVMKIKKSPQNCELENYYAIVEIFTHFKFMDKPALVKK